jgi:hypothetical protein
MQGASLTSTLRLLASVPSHSLVLVTALLNLLLELHAYPPTCRALIDPPYAFAAKESVSDVVVAEHLEQLAFRTLTERPLAFVAAHLLLLLSLALALHVYPPMCKALIDPPYEFAPTIAPSVTVVDALQSEQGALLISTLRPLTVVAAHVLTVLPMPKLHVYAPI